MAIFSILFGFALFLFITDVVNSKGKTTTMWNFVPLQVGVERKKVLVLDDWWPNDADCTQVPRGVQHLGTHAVGILGRS